MEWFQAWDIDKTNDDDKDEQLTHTPSLKKKAIQNNTTAREREV